MVFILSNADELVISFRFPPITDISGIVVAKRIIEDGIQVDVLHNDVENFDYISLDIADEFINERMTVSIDAVRDNVECIQSFIRDGMDILKDRPVYERIYSRSWLMSNHFLAMEYKFRNSNVFWRAEFSDPVYRNIDTGKGKTFKKAHIDDKQFITHLNDEIEKYNELNDTNFAKLDNPNNTYFIAEYLSLLFADELIFTNPNQRQIMLEYYGEDMKDIVFKKSTFSPHPTLSDEYYHLEKSDIQLNGDDINIAYFGSFYYISRHFEPLFYAFESLNHRYKDRIKFHLFIHQDSFLKILMDSLTFKDNIILRKPLEYLEFLNATTKFDILLINDTITGEIFTVNPYLPSKLSDYLGANRDIWAIYEEGSILSKSDVRYKSSMNDYNQSSEVLIRILDDYGYGDDACTVSEHYHEKRITDLNKILKNEFDAKNSAEKKNRKLKKEIEKLKAENRKLKKENEAVMSSHSWKITKPLRGLNRFKK